MILNRFIELVPKNKEGCPLITMKTTSYELAGYRFKIVTPEVVSTDEKGNITRWGADDNTFNLYSGLAELSPRGLSFVTVYKGSDKILEHSIRGYKKFTSLDNVDEDTDIACSNLIKPDLIKTANYAVLTKKANGKFVVMNMFTLDNVLFIFGGSKAVHRVVRYNNILEDLNTIEMQQSSGNLSLVKGIFISLLNSNISCQELLLNYNITGEYEDGKHLVPVKDGIPIIKWFGLIPQTESVKILGIVDSLKQITNTGLSTVEYTISKPSDIVRHKLREGTMMEGYVIHWCDSDGHTLEMEKFKCWWYVILRVLRTLILNKKTNFLKNYKTLLKKRLAERNKSFMHMSKKTLAQWHDLCCAFMDWFLLKKYDPNIVDINECNRGMGSVYLEFITENPTINDNIPAGEIADESDIDDVAIPVALNRLVIIMQGIPGLGKNAVAEIVEQISSVKIVSLDQDSFVKKYDKTAGAQCFKVFNSLLTEMESGVIMLLRNNADTSQYGKYVDSAHDNNWNTIIVTVADIFKSDSHLTALFNVCADAVVTREHHPSFDKLSRDKRLQVIISFMSILKNTAPPEAGVDATFVENLTWLQDTVEIDFESISNFKNYLDSGYGFKIPEKKKVPILSHDKCIAMRRNINDIATDINNIIIKYFNASGMPMLDHVPKKSEPLFICLELSKDDQALLESHIPVDFDRSGRKFMSHVTLMHSNDLNDTTTEKWNYLKYLAKNNTVIAVTVDKIYTTNNTLIFGVSLAEDIVFSKKPHITGYLPKELKPVESLKLMSMIDKQIALNINLNLKVNVNGKMH